MELLFGVNILLGLRTLVHQLMKFHFPRPPYGQCGGMSTQCLVLSPAIYVLKIFLRFKGPSNIEDETYRVSIGMH